MSNVVYLNVPGPKERRAARFGAMTRAFATHRRGPEDVFWLKENAELLNILENTGQEVPQRLLAPYAEFYDHAREKLAFFPQYYRFILSMALDLEALGMAGTEAEAMCAWVARQDLAGGETSDIQRMEAARLLRRRGFDALHDQAAAEARLRDFVSRPDRFALPNKKAAFELTHIVFYLSEYGRKDPQLGPEVLRSLENAGILAFLDGNLDLLAEVCVAMRYAGCNPSVTWEDWITRKMQEFDIRPETPKGRAVGAPAADQYHEYLTGSWLSGARGQTVFAEVPATTEDCRLSFHRPAASRGALREISVQLYRLGAERREIWQEMRGTIDAALSEAARSRLQQAEASTGHFEAFFEDFSRAQQVSA